MNEYDELQIAQVFGVRIEWLYEIDKACDAFFKKRGMKTQSIREQITLEQCLGKRTRDARKRIHESPSGLRV